MKLTIQKTYWENSYCWCA